MGMLNWGGMGSNLMSMGRYAMGTKYGIGAMAGAGALMTGGIAGGVNRNNTVMGGMGNVAGSATRGAMYGGTLGALGAIGVAGYGIFKGGGMAGIAGSLFTKAGLGRLATLGPFIGRAALFGAKAGALGGVGFGVMKAGLGSNRPVNPIRGFR